MLAVVNIDTPSCPVLLFLRVATDAMNGLPTWGRIHSQREGRRKFCNVFEEFSVPQQVLQTVGADGKSTEENEIECTLPFLRKLRLMLPSSHTSGEALVRWFSQDVCLVIPIVNEGSIDGTG